VIWQGKTFFAFLQAGGSQSEVNYPWYKSGIHQEEAMTDYQHPAENNMMFSNLVEVARSRAAEQKQKRSINLSSK